MQDKKDIKALLDYHMEIKNSKQNLANSADPLQVASIHKDPYISLICALFAYGNANLIVKFLNLLNFELLQESDKEIRKFYKTYKYRFQNSQDVAEIFITIKRLKENFSVEDLVKSGLDKNGAIEYGVRNLIDEIFRINSYNSRGYQFFFGKSFDKTPTSPYKRYNMYLRWMVRDKDIDLGLFKSIDKSTLLMPLDLHTHRVSLALGLLGRKSYDFKAVMELTKRVRKFDPKDPIKYDFALYRLGQSGEIKEILELV
ncbi:MAG: TIGR02757 family protein [Campylobacter sp.]|nr:TIGR02757 family protein [Campylobacter sp.]